MAADANDAAVVLEFLDELRTIREADEFEHLMLGKHQEPSLDRVEDCIDAFTVLSAFDGLGQVTAVKELRGQRALERLQQRHSEVWQRVERAAVLDV